MEKWLIGKKAIITGGTRGIGKGIAKKFIEHGASVALIGTDTARGEGALQELSTYGDDSQKILFYELDVSNFESVSATFSKIFEEFKTIDILVNNAGITRDNLLMKISEEDWEKVLNTNLKSIFNTCKAVIRPMMKSRMGKIINITSIVGLTGNAGQTNYAASKSGMIGFTKSLAKEVGSRNINVNCIAPGFISTAMTEELSEEVRKKYLEQIPLGRLGEPEDIANATLFLASPFSNYITGQVITVDGGMTM